MGLSFTQNGYFSLKNRQHLFLVVQNASRCIGTKGEDHSENSGRNQKMTPTPTRMLQDPPWCRRKCIELAKTTSFAAYCRTLNPVKRSNWPVFVSNLWIEVTSTFLFKYFYCRKVWWTSFITSWRKTHKQQISWQSLANCSTVTPTKVSLLWGK